MAEPASPPEPTRAGAPPRLERSIGLLGLTFVAVGGIVGSGWLFAPLLAAQLAGPAAVVSWAIGGAAMLILALCFAEVVGVLPVAGGIARIPHFTHGDVTSAILGWSAWVGYNTAAPIETIAMLQYLEVDAPWLFHGEGVHGELTPAGMATAASVLAVFVAINALGAAFFARANTLITWVKLGIPLLVGGAILAARFEPGNFGGAGGFAPMGIQGIFAAVSTGGVIFALIGFRHAIDMAGETRKPRVTIPLALTLSIVIAVGVYGLIQLAFIGALDAADLREGWPELHFEHELGPVAGVAAALGIGWISMTLGAGALLSPFGGGLVATGSMARLGYALAQTRVFPAFFDHLSRRGVPLRSLLLNFAMGALVVALVPFGEAVALNGAAITLSFCAGPLAVRALRAQFPEAPRRFSLPFVGLTARLGFIVATLIVYWSGWGTTWRLLLIVAAGLLVFALRMRAERVTSDLLDLRGARWLLPYGAGLTLLSWLGDFGGGRDLLRFPWDLAAATALALGVFSYGHACRLSDEQAAAQRERYRIDLPPDLTPL